MLARVLAAAGITAASVGFGFYGIATSAYEYDTRWGSLGIYLMIGGVIAAIVGLLWNRSQESGLR